MNIVKIDKCGVCGGKEFEEVMRCREEYGSGECFEICGWKEWGLELSDGVGVEGEIGG